MESTSFREDLTQFLMVLLLRLSVREPRVFPPLGWFRTRSLSRLLASHALNFNFDDCHITNRTLGIVRWFA